MASMGLEEIWLDAYRTLTGWTWTDDVMLGNVDALLHRFHASHWECCARGVRERLNCSSFSSPTYTYKYTLLHCSRVVLQSVVNASDTK